VISGMKMLATGAVYANEIWIGNVIPLAPDQKKESITCVIPCNAPGLALWSRKPMALDARSEFDSPLAFRYDESDSMLLCDNVKVPWEKVFVHDDALLSRDIYVKSASHCFGNHQSNVRYWSKMRLLLGLCSKIAHATGADQVPAVRETLGKMAAVEATIGGLVHGQINAFESWPEGYVCFNRRIMYAGHAVARMKLFRLAWDMVGSEFAGRHLQYEKFYAGASFIIRNHSYREADWDGFNKLVEDLMAGYEAPAQATKAGGVAAE
jgi:4-hydroxyphenylacetate 3-monooxygenase